MLGVMTTPRRVLVFVTSVRAVVYFRPAIQRRQKRTIEK